jgi:antitoxin MazE
MPWGESGYAVTVTISKWGNSLAVRLPKDALDQADLHEGDLLEVSTEGQTITLTLRDAPPSLDELVARITPENRHGEVFGTLSGAEIW